jgi:hypothetical protein
VHSSKSLDGDRDADERAIPAGSDRRNNRGRSPAGPVDDQSEYVLDDSVRSALPPKE